MTVYHAPVQDWQFLLHDVLNIRQYENLPGFEDLNPEFTYQVLAAAADFHENVLHPLNLRGDAEGARLEHGKVRTPDGFAAAWKAYRAAGWHCISLPQRLGGAGLPPLMAVPIAEMRTATGHAFSMYGSFCAPAANMLDQLAPEWIRTHVVPKIAAGEWTATMCMTEPQAGTDLRQLRTRATPQPDGSWHISGQKIFITGAEHDLTDNIVHLVLAKVADATGEFSDRLENVSVFLVSQHQLNPHNGSLGARNGVRVESLEKKMGIEASATCAVTLDRATGWRISDERAQGSAANMAPMFLLMNYARVNTAVAGIAYAEIARQNAADYARGRLSGRAPKRQRGPEQSADPIIAHADVRRLLLESRAFAEGARAGALRAALWQSLAQDAPDAALRERASLLLDVLTPIMKAFFTDQGFQATVACQQVLGGHGYIKDYGLEQMVRNVRVTQIYEGANGIQALDLIQRKLQTRQRRARQAFFDTLLESCAKHANTSALQQAAQRLEAACRQIATTLEWLDEHQARDGDALGSAAYDILTAMGIVYVAWNWLEIVAQLQHQDACAHIEPDQVQVKRNLEQVWRERKLPLVAALCERAMASSASLMELPDTLI